MKKSELNEKINELQKKIDWLNEKIKTEKFDKVFHEIVNFEERLEKSDIISGFSIDAFFDRGNSITDLNRTYYTIKFTINS